MSIHRWAVSIGIFVTLLVGMGLSTQWVSAEGNEGESPFGGVTAYGTMIFFEGMGFAEMELTEAQPISVITTTYFYNAIDVANDVFTTAYALNGTNLVAVNTATGAETLIGAATPVAGETWSGMTWDRTTNTMYAVASADCTQKMSTFSLYTLNLSTGAATRINTGFRPSCVMDIAAHPITGVLYGVSLYHNPINEDRIITIDKATTNIDVVVELGFDAAPQRHGLDFDDSTGVLYYAYSANKLQEIYTVNVQGGPMNRIYQSSTGVRMDDFAIARAGAPLPIVEAEPMALGATHMSPPEITTDTLTIRNTGGVSLTWSLFEDESGGRCEVVNEIKWLSTDVTSGTIPAGGSTEVEVTFDSTGLGPMGTVFYGDLCVASNDQSAPVVPIATSLVVGAVVAVTLDDLNVAPVTPWLSFGFVGLLALAGVVAWRRTAVNS